ncbi:ESX secretion-associated protein EspG [Mycolicibacterium hippocampi]|uniref:ESX secretion-associated protein EspG n=1 Tax=Mycolicibacterium hippocampi TaxID=659824 RepID=UPI00351219D9
MTYELSFAQTPVDSVAVVDLESACALFGWETLPYPLGRSRPVGSVWLATRAGEPIAERLAGGDLPGIRSWVESLVRSDVCVECRVHPFDVQTPDLRLHALRAGESGFVAVQTRDQDGVDVVDIYSVAPDALAAAIAESVGLVGAGAHPRIAVAGDGIHLPAMPDTAEQYDDLGFPVQHAESDELPDRVCGVSEVVATGTVQTRWAGERQWGTDPQSRILQWVQVSGDGDYVYEFDGHAEPMTEDMLRSFIDGFIAEGMATTRAPRGLM